MELIIDVAGGVRCIDDEAIDLAALGELSIKRASHVEPNEEGKWWADMAPVDGPRLGPFEKRSMALVAERKWLMAKLIQSETLLTHEPRRRQ